jgi:thiosulfate dehydrogenase [quinone] large subunit
MPSFLTTPFYFCLGGGLILLGLLLLFGIRTRETLLIMGLLYCMLTVGLILLGQEQGVAWLGIHVLAVVAALVLAPFNRFSITKV